VYARELAHVPVRIIVPKGSYVPFFVCNDRSEEARDSFRRPSTSATPHRAGLSAA
jgi:hypothetical protein